LKEIQKEGKNREKLIEKEEENQRKNEWLKDDVTYYHLRDGVMECHRIVFVVGSLVKGFDAVVGAGDLATHSRKHKSHIAKDQFAEVRTSDRGSDILLFR
jgi:hypothetical protein